MHQIAAIVATWQGRECEPEHAMREIREVIDGEADRVIRCE